MFVSVFVFFVFLFLGRFVFLVYILGLLFLFAFFVKLIPGNRNLNTRLTSNEMFTEKNYFRKLRILHF